MSSKPRADVQRREIALVAGVTPALVSYYYPDKWDLFAAAAKPVIADYIETARSTLRVDASPGTTFRSLIYFCLKFNVRNGYLLDFCIENGDRLENKCDLRGLRDVEKDIMSFFEQTFRNGLIRGASSEFIQSSIWGLCKYTARQSHLADMAKSPEMEDVIRQMTDRLCDLSLNGIGTPEMSRQCADHAPLE